MQPSRSPSSERPVVLSLTKATNAHTTLAAQVKFPGSGGAVVGLAKCAEDLRSLQTAYEDEGYVFCRLEPFHPLDHRA